MSTASVPHSNTPIAKGFLDRIDAYNHGQKLRQVLGITAATELANALFRDGRNDSLEVLAQVRPIHAAYPTCWEYVAGGLDPDNRHTDGSTRQGC